MPAPQKRQRFRGALKPAPSQVFTIGHSTRPARDFIALLRAHGVRRVIDVRTVPRSRHNPQFDRAALAKSLHSARIHYTHLAALGGRRHARRDSTNLGWRNASFRGFADYMQTTQFHEGLQRLMEIAAEEPCVIMCAEAVPWRCHRSLIADALTARKVEVRHITSRTRAEPHRLTSFARVREATITYPGTVLRSAKARDAGNAPERS
jgi:uncharacterized protein (DUF488 family)